MGASVFPLLLSQMSRSLTFRGLSVGLVWGGVLLPCTKGHNFSTLRAPLQWVSLIHLHGWCSFTGATGFQLHSLPSSQLPPQEANCEDHYSRQQEEWISQLNILLDYPTNPFLWVRTALGLKSLKTKQHRSCNILKQSNGQPQGWVKHCSGKEHDGSQPGCLHQS